MILFTISTFIINYYYSISLGDEGEKTKATSPKIHCEIKILVDLW